MRMILTKLWNFCSKATHGFWWHRGSDGKSSGFLIVQYAVSSILDTLVQWIKLPEEYAEAIQIGLHPEDKEEPIDIILSVLKPKIF